MYNPLTAFPNGNGESFSGCFRERAQGRVVSAYFSPAWAGVEFSTLSVDRLLRLHRVHSLCLSP